MPKLPPNLRAATAPQPTFKRYRQHHCTRAHRTYNALAKCMWPRAVWVCGEGPYATVSRCPSGGRRNALTVALWSTHEAALSAKKIIDDSMCGGSCWGARGHEIVQLINPS
ncbi:hypothetical protein [Streptomyces sp. NPDC005438]|uniref:hypothetical protein n=1 Tax=Streptomyces sp. NPDC005438 TaxID=3156880 RepID=UPI0033ACE706